MTAGIFARHGVWTGSCFMGDRHNPRGYFENIDIKSLMKMWFGNLVHENKLATPRENWKQAVEHTIREDGYHSGPWLVKTSPLYYRVWEEFSPFWVNVRRPKEHIINSCLKTRMVNRPKEDLGRFIDFHNELMDQRGVDVFTEELIDGDYSSLENAFDYCGLEFNETIARNFIREDHWHFRSSL